jgi:glycosyltransferase involved in cell wall biosynthesis
MTTTRLVSVITIFFNAENFLEEAINSVLSQTYNDWELLLVDDGSRDESTCIARRYAEKYPTKVHYSEHFGHENRGMSASRNLGIRNAVGNYIALLDADDVWMPHKLERQVTVLESRPDIGMLFGPNHYWYSWTGEVGDRDRDRLIPAGVPGEIVFDPPHLLTLLLLGKVNPPSPSDIIFRREVVNRIGAFEESFCGMFEDQVFISKVFLNEKVFITDESYDKYRRHPNSCYSEAKRLGQVEAARLRFLRWVELYLRQRKMENTETWRALEHALWPYRHPLLYRLTSSARYWFTQLRKPRAKPN